MFAGVAVAGFQKLLDESEGIRDQIVHRAPWGRSAECRWEVGTEGVTRRGRSVTCGAHAPGVHKARYIIIARSITTPMQILFNVKWLDLNQSEISSEPKFK